MYRYSITAQFAKAGAPSLNTPGYMDYLHEARDFFDMKSRVATNPKKILELSIVDDETLKIILQSEDKLNISQVSRSLRIFSRYLCDETHPLNFACLISGSRLFRMKAEEILDEENGGTEIEESYTTANRVKKQQEGREEGNDAHRFEYAEKETKVQDMMIALALLLKEEKKTAENAKDVEYIQYLLEKFMARRQTSEYAGGNRE